MARKEIILNQKISRETASQRQHKEFGKIHTMSKTVIRYELNPVSGKYEKTSVTYTVQARAVDIPRRKLEGYVLNE